ncbi:MAG: hypothetical protein GXO11_00460 [Epsilonproteobacteria bacterium]|nr:hypothetical protein [Campylobacterota bacterium]
MKELLTKKIPNASSVVIVLPEEVDVDLYGSASVLYTYILQLHKKVFLISKKDIDQKYFVIPWIDKAKKTIPKHVDLILTCKDELISNQENIVLETYRKNVICLTQLLFEVMKSLHVKINPKMATALYSGLIVRTDMFSLKEVDGIIFALAKELIELGADHKNVVKYLQKYSTLSQLRLLGKMLSEMELLLDARVACFSVSYELLKQCGATYKDCDVAVQKALELPTVKFSVLIVEMEDLTIRGSIESHQVESVQKNVEFESIISLQEAKEKILEKVKEIETKEQ